jgi:transposase InsO family protein
LANTQLATVPSKTGHARGVEQPGAKVNDMSQIHPQARTTPRVRAEIQASEDSPAELARRYNISEPTAAKWQARDSVEDRSHRPHKLSTTLSPAQEAIVVELRRLLLLPLDDLLVITREFVNAQASRSALDRCLRRHGVNNLRELQAAASGESAQAAPPKRFKDYEPGFVHVDIKYLPQMPDETARRYLYVGIDRATRWVFVRIYADMETTSAVDFVNRLHEAAPMRIDKLLTDNGACFTDRFQRKSRTPSGKHHFDVRCRALGIEHRLCPPRHPQTNGLVERFNGRIAEITAQTRFHSAAELEQTLMNYVKVYNTRIPQRALDHHTPLDALKSWRAKSPDLFKKRPKNLPGLDKYASLAGLPNTKSPV